MKTIRIDKESGNALNLSKFPNFSATGSIIGMKRKYYGMDAMLIQCGNYIYNVDEETYNKAKSL